MGNQIYILDNKIPGDYNTIVPDDLFLLVDFSKEKEIYKIGTYSYDVLKVAVVQGSYTPSANFEILSVGTDRILYVNPALDINLDNCRVKIFENGDAFDLGTKTTIGTYTGYAIPQSATFGLETGVDYKFSFWRRVIINDNTTNTNTTWSSQKINTKVQTKEDKFLKNTAFNKDFGVLVDQVARGNHSHNLSDLNNDSGFITGVSNITEIPLRSYNNLQDLPTLYDSADFDADLIASTTDDLSEGTTNLYNRQADWEQADISGSDYIKNKPTNVTSLSVRNINDIEEFKITDVVRFQGFLFDSANKTITNTPTVVKTIFVDTVNGNDNTAQIQNYSKPFKTDQAAYDAIPADGSKWSINFIDGNVTRNMTGSFPDIPKYFEIVSKSLGVFDFTNCPKATTNQGLKIDVPNATILINEGVGGNFGVVNNTNFLNFYITCKEFTFNRNNGSLINNAYNKGSSYLNANIVNIYYSNSLIFEGEINVENFNVFNGVAGIIRSGGITLNISVLNLENGGLLSSNYSGAVIKSNIKKITGAGELSFVTGGFSGEITVNFDDAIIDGISSIKAIYNAIGTGTINLSGQILTEIPVNFFGRTTSYSGNINLNNFKGRINDFRAACFDIKITNSDIRTSGPIFNVTTHPNYLISKIKNLTFIGYNVITQDTVGPLTINALENGYFKIKGALSTNASYYGDKTYGDYQTATFKEKQHEIIIRDKRDFINKELNPLTTYVLDGDIVLEEGEHIRVPSTGLTLKGYGFDTSKLSSYGVPFHNIFISDLNNIVKDIHGTSDGISKPINDYGELGLRSGDSSILLNRGNLEFNINHTSSFNAFHTNVGASTIPYSVGLWFKPIETEAGRSQALMFVGTKQAQNNFCLYLNSSNNLYLRLGNVITLIASGVTNNVFHYFEMKWNGTSVTAVFDNNAEITGLNGDQQNYNNNGDQIMVGISYDAYIKPIMKFDGFIGGLFVYARARTSTESTNTYNGGVGIDYTSEVKTDLVSYYDMNDTPVGGSGNLILSDIAFTVTGYKSRVFKHRDIDGSHAIEINDVNFEGCKSLGKIHGYRQFVGTTLGIYGCEDGLTLSGNWTGFKVSNTNAFGFGNNGTLLKAGVGLSFNNRLYLEFNMDLPTGAILSDVSPNNFEVNDLFQISSTILKYNGIIDDSNSDIVIPNISANNPKCLWRNNIGLPDTAVEKIIDTDVAGTFEIDWFNDTFNLNMTADTTFTDINLPASGKSTKEIQLYINGNFTPTFPAGWETNKVGTFKPGELNKMTVKFIKTGVYFTKIDNSLTVYPAPSLGTVVPAGLLPSQSQLLTLNGSFFTPASIVTIEGQTVSTIKFIEDTGALELTVITGATEGDFDIFVSNGTGVTFQNKLIVALGTVFIPQTSEWILTEPINVIDNNVYIETFGTAGTAEWNRIIDYTKDFSVRFRYKRSPLGNANRMQENAAPHIAIRRVSDGAPVIRVNFKNDGAADTVRPIIYTLDGELYQSLPSVNNLIESEISAFENVVFEFRMVNGNFSYYEDSTLKSGFTVTTTENLYITSTLKYFDIVDIKFIELI